VRCSLCAVVPVCGVPCVQCSLCAVFPVCSVPCVRCSLCAVFPVCGVPCAVCMQVTLRTTATSPDRLGGRRVSPPELTDTTHREGELEEEVRLCASSSSTWNAHGKGGEGGKEDEVC
jgi:hypothetical protein